jgi:Flp pilus assembly protein TadG
MQRPPYPVRTADARRRGSATVEFAVISPLFLLLLLGTVEMGSAINATQKLYSALREGGRLASMDYQNMSHIDDDVDINAKVLADIRNFLTASGIPGDDVEIAVVHAGEPNDGQAFDLSDPNNNLKLFRIEATVPYESVSTFPLEQMAGQDVSASMTFRKGRVSLAN